MSGTEEGFWDWGTHLVRDRRERISHDIKSLFSDGERAVRHRVLTPEFASRRPSGVVRELMMAGTFCAKADGSLWEDAEAEYVPNEFPPATAARMGCLVGEYMVLRMGNLRRAHKSPGAPSLIDPDFPHLNAVVDSAALFRTLPVRAAACELLFSARLFGMARHKEYIVYLGIGRKSFFSLGVIFIFSSRINNLHVPLFLRSRCEGATACLPAITMCRFSPLL